MGKIFHFGKLRMAQPEKNISLEFKTKRRMPFVASAKKGFRILSERW
jgi:hypothetical protein